MMRIPWSLPAGEQVLGLTSLRTADKQYLVAAHYFPSAFTISSFDWAEEEQRPSLTLEEVIVHSSRMESHPQDWRGGRTWRLWDSPAGPHDYPRAGVGQLLNDYTLVYTQFGGRAIHVLNLETGTRRSITGFRDRIDYFVMPSPTVVLTLENVNNPGRLALDETRLTMYDIYRGGRAHTKITRPLSTFGLTTRDGQPVDHEFLMQNASFLYGLTLVGDALHCITDKRSPLPHGIYRLTGPASLNHAFVEGTLERISPEITGNGLAPITTPHGEGFLVSEYNFSWDAPFSEPTTISLLLP